MLVETIVNAQPQTFISMSYDTLSVHHAARHGPAIKILSFQILVYFSGSVKNEKKTAVQTTFCLLILDSILVKYFTLTEHFCA